MVGDGQIIRKPGSKVVDGKPQTAVTDTAGDRQGIGGWAQSHR